MRFLLSSSQKSEKKSSSNKKTPPVSASSSKSVPPSSSRSTSAKKKKDSRVETAKKVEIKKPINKKKSKKASLEPETMTTKSETAPAKEVDKCLLCQWAFPVSFRGEEKNVHMGRCMEDQGEQDKKFWAQCYGDLKRYQYNDSVNFFSPSPRFNFEENQSVRSVSKKPKEKSAKKSAKNKEDKKRSQSPEEKKPRKKKDESIAPKKEKKGKKEEKPKKEKKNKNDKEETKTGKRSRKDEDLLNSQFEPLNMKKIKIEGI